MVVSRRMGVSKRRMGVGHRSGKTVRVVCNGMSIAQLVNNYYVRHSPMCFLHPMRLYFSVLIPYALLYPSSGLIMAD